MCLPHERWRQNGNNHRPPYVKDISYFLNSGLSLGLTNRDRQLDKFSRANIQNAYSNMPNFSVQGKDWNITTWSPAKHGHHAAEFGLNPVDYGMTKQDLTNIAQKGFIRNIRQEKTPPNEEFVKALQERWENFAENPEVRNCGIQNVMGKNCHILKYDKTGLFLAIKVDNVENYTGYRLNRLQFIKHNTIGIIGKKYKN
jgi:hypothetical protein